MVFLLYGIAVLAALALLFFFHANWYWHLGSVILALGIGMAPPGWIPLPAAWGIARDVVVGCIFLFLISWGLCAPLFGWAKGHRPGTDMPRNLLHH